MYALLKLTQARSHVYVQVLNNGVVSQNELDKISILIKLSETFHRYQFNERSVLSDVLPLGDSVSEIHFSALSIMTSALRLHRPHLNIPGTPHI